MSDNNETRYIAGERAAYVRMLDFIIGNLGRVENGAEHWRIERETLIVALAPLAEVVGRPLQPGVYLPDQVQKIVDWALATWAGPEKEE